MTMHNTHRCWLGAALVLFALVGTSAQADLIADAREIEISLAQQEAQYRQIVAQFRNKSGGLPSELAVGLAAATESAERCVTALGRARFYAKRIQSGDKSSENIKHLKNHMHQVQLRKVECNRSLEQFSAVAKAYLSARR
jgi:hypothetical protein